MARSSAIARVVLAALGSTALACQLVFPFDGYSGGDAPADAGQPLDRASTRPGDAAELLAPADDAEAAADNRDATPPPGNGVSCSTADGQPCGAGRACCEVWGGGQDHCIARTQAASCPGEDPSQTSVIDCDDPHDCAATQACCGMTLPGPLVLFRAACVVAADCTGTGKTRLCTSIDQCRAGEGCNPLSPQNAGPYSACQP